MANARNKEVDTTYLSMDLAAVRGFIHRDYLAHTLRYSHTAKFIHQKGRHKTAHVLDVGCGRELPLAKLMFSSRMTHTTGSYTAVDYGPVPWPASISTKTKKFKLTILEESDFTTVELPRKKFDVAVSLEVLEHVEAYHAYRMLCRMRAVLKAQGTAILSTPCYDPKTGAAANHVNEMSHVGFRALIEAAGLEVKQVWGTFASQKDYKHTMDAAYPGSRAIFDELRMYYDRNVVACLFAPLFPEQARNCLWKVKPGRVQLPDKKQLTELAKPQHGSSQRWAKDLRKIMKEASR